MKIPKLDIIEWSVVIFVALILILIVIQITEPDNTPSLIEGFGETVRSVEDEFKKGYNKDSIQ